MSIISQLSGSIIKIDFHTFSHGWGQLFVFAWAVICSLGFLCWDLLGDWILLLKCSPANHSSELFLAKFIFKDINSHHGPGLLLKRYLPKENPNDDDDDITWQESILVRINALKKLLYCCVQSAYTFSQSKSVTKFYFTCCDVCCDVCLLALV